MPPIKSERKFESPVAWLLGRQLMGSIKGTLLYTAYGKKLDPRDWMQASVFPFREKALALEFWRRFSEKRRAHGQHREAPPISDESDEKFWQRKNEFWFDYIADTGDGSKATYSIAFLCMSDLYVNSRDPQKLAAGAPVQIPKKGQAMPGSEVLPRGEFLFIGGDTAYHLSDYMTLANRVQRPFEWAYEDLREDGGISDTEPNRLLFGIPGNHDYYDQLDGFRRQFRHPVRKEPTDGLFAPDADDADKPQLFIPGFNRLQEASYVALHLPFDWWFWGLDTEVGQIDERQRKFFRDLCEQDTDDPEAVTAPKKLIVATCAPTTVFGKIADPNDGKAADAVGQLELSQPFLPEPKRSSGKYNLDTAGDSKMQEGQCRLDISGDVHHYARYWGPKPKTDKKTRKRAKAKAPSAESYASVVSGIGGAFHHPSGTYVDEIQEQVLYPSEPDSTKEIAQRIFKFWNIWGGGFVWLAGGILAFIIYFAAAVPQSSKQVINNFPLLKELGLTHERIEPITPTSMSEPLGMNPSARVEDALTAAATEPVVPFWSQALAFITRSSDPRATWIPPATPELNKHRYFYWPYRVEWPWDLTIAVWLALLSSIPLFAATFSKKLFSVQAKTTSQVAEVKPSRVEKTPQGSQIRTAATDPEIKADPHTWLWTVTVVSSLMIFYGLAAIRPYRAHITPFGSSMMVLLSIIWTVAAMSLSIRYSEFLFKKSHREYIHSIDWALTWVLTILGLLCAAFGLWSLGRNNLPALLVSDLFFVLIVVGTFIGLLLLPFKVGAELLQPHGRVVRGAGKFLIGLWHALLQISVPFLLVRKGTYLTWAVALILVFVPIKIGEYFLRKNSRTWLLLTWIAYGAVVLALPYLTNPQWWPMPQPFLDKEWSGWWGFVPSLLAGIVGAVMCCVWFGWYLGICFAFNGHNNEVGGAARIEEFKQFIRFCLTKDGLTGYVIGLDHPMDSETRELLKPKVIDVFHLSVKT